MLELARAGRPFLMNVQSSATTRRRFSLHRETMAEAGFEDDRIAANLDQCWVWRNVFVADSQADAERVGISAFEAMAASRAEMRNRIYRETGLRIEVPASDLPSAPASVEHGFICGSPARVAEAVAEIAELGIGGVIATFRLGRLPHEAAVDSLRLFMTEVALRFRTRQFDSAEMSADQPNVDPNHVYSLVELIDIAQRRNPRRKPISGGTSVTCSSDICDNLSLAPVQ
jgi:alkanesulfonate monooxygenase SsuD/methylene tetrahydromethanopterin reductase-like flavin-dependent oxidoreductase (luciferase family)